jgi:hypothetical protein
MLASKPFAFLLALSGIAVMASSAVAQSGVRYYEKDGMTYRESRSVIQRPVTQTELQPRERVTYREQVSTSYEPRSRTVYTPVTTYQWQARWQDVLNPFKPATMAYQLVPQTQWQAHVQQVETPITRREMVPQREVVDVPVTTRRYVDEEVIRRTVVNPSQGTSVARREVIGGVSSLENDPPRDGANWRPAGN